MKITDDHVYLLGAYIAVLNSEYCLSNIRQTKGFVRDLKGKTNKYLDFLQIEVYKQFKQAYEIDEQTMDNLFDRMVKRNSFQVDEFLKDMVK